MKTRCISLGDFMSSEFVFLTFLFAGLYKQTPFVAWLNEQVDITLITTIIGIFAAGFVCFTRGVKLSSTQLAFALLYLALLSMATLSYLMRLDPHDLATLKIAKLLVFNRWAVLMPLIVINSPKRIVRVLRLLFVFGTLVSFQALFHTRSMDEAHFVGAFGTDDYHMLGYMSAIGVIVGVSLALAEARQLIRLCLVGIAAIAVLVIFLSSSRQTLVALLPSVLCVFAYFNTGIRWNLLIGRFATFLVLFGIIFSFVKAHLLSNTNADFAFDRMLAIFGADSSEVVVASQRPEIWNAAIGIFLDHPIFGAGFGSFPELYGAARHPHNFFLELLAELGIVGFVLGVSMVSVTASCVLKRTGVHVLWWQAAARAIWVFLFTCAMVSGDMTDNRAMFAFMALSLACASPVVQKAGVTRSSAPSMQRGSRSIPQRPNRAAATAYSHRANSITVAARRSRL